jgi:hypothetical protein
MGCKGYIEPATYLSTELTLLTQQRHIRLVKPSLDVGRHDCSYPAIAHADVISSFYLSECCSNVSGATVVIQKLLHSYFVEQPETRSSRPKIRYTVPALESRTQVNLSSTQFLQTCGTHARLLEGFTHTPDKPTAMSGNTSKRSAQKKSPQVIKRQKVTLARPKLNLDCRVPPRPLPQQLTSRPLIDPPGIGDSGFLDTKKKTSQYHSSQPTIPDEERRRTHEQPYWPLNNQPCSANTRFMISCTTSAVSVSVYTSSASARKCPVCHRVFESNECGWKSPSRQHFVTLIESIQISIRELLQLPSHAFSSSSSNHLSAE